MRRVVQTCRPVACLGFSHERRAWVHPRGQTFGGAACPAEGAAFLAEEAPLHFVAGGWAQGATAKILRRDQIGTPQVDGWRRGASRDDSR
jgi:hypothetical protein